MSLSLLLSQEQTGRLNYVLSLNLVPLQVCRITLCSNAYALTVYNQLAVLDISLNSAIESTVHGVILQHVSQVIYRAQIVDTYNFNVVTILSGTKNETTDTAETINTYFCCHFFNIFKGLEIIAISHNYNNEMTCMLQETGLREAKYANTSTFSSTFFSLWSQNYNILFNFAFD